MANFKTITFFKLLRETKDYQGKYVSQGALDFLSNSYCQVMYYIKQGNMVELDNLIEDCQIEYLVSNVT